jgi:hypothetical protein
MKPDFMVIVPEDAEWTSFNAAPSVPHHNVC